MTLEEFEQSSQRICMCSVGWKSLIARKLGINAREVRRWFTSGVLPDWVEGEINTLLQKMGGSAQWPRDAWIIGSAVRKNGVSSGHSYVGTLMAPLFHARIVLCDKDGKPLKNEGEADILSGAVYFADQHESKKPFALCEVVSDERATSEDVTNMLMMAVDIVLDFKGWRKDDKSLTF